MIWIAVRLTLAGVLLVRGRPGPVRQAVAGYILPGPARFLIGGAGIGGALVRDALQRRRARSEPVDEARGAEPDHRPPRA